MTKTARDFPLLAPLAAARTLLGVDADVDDLSLKRALRRRTIECPPDRDPEGFRETREAHDLLTDVVGWLRGRLTSTEYQGPLPRLRTIEVEPMMQTLLHECIRDLDAQAFLDEDT